VNNDLSAYADKDRDVKKPAAGGVRASGGPTTAARFTVAPVTESLGAVAAAAAVTEGPNAAPAVKKPIITTVDPALEFDLRKVEFTTGATALYRKSDLCIPRNETARPRS
jgi:hypothetical protein